MLTRRDALRVAAAAVLVPAAAGPARAAGFTLPPLPYPADALEPHIDAVTMETHHGKHHKTYVDNLNAALKGMDDWLAKPVGEVLTKLKELPADKQTAVRNNGGGHYNHELFWKVMAKPGAGGGGTPKAELAKAIDDSFGSFDKFQAAFKEAAVKQFGSGWAWLVPGTDKPLKIVQSANQDNPLIVGGPAPILGVDVWEHAYYLKYKNLRAAYLDAWWNVVNWDYVGGRYAAAQKG